MHPLSSKLIYQIALTQIKGVGDVLARNLLQAVGDEEAIFASSRRSLQQIKGISGKLVDEILNPEVMRKAETEILFIEKNGIKPIFINSADYPQRFKDCGDAPILLYQKGNADLNASKIVSVIGTRHSSDYGNAFCDTLLHDLATIHPNILVVSGLAYGIDINAHRSALKHNLPTVGVLAHGLDRIYPSAHRQTAMDMLADGGLLTEFPSKTAPDKFNFVRRNRIVAGIADAIIVVESDVKGGSLITADIANSYCKDVFAVPGKTTNPKSQGCNKLIASHKADLFASTDYFLQQMGWDSQSPKTKKAPQQKGLFTELTYEGQLIVDTLSQQGALHVDILAREVGIPSYQLFSILLELEMKGIVSNRPGNTFVLNL